MKLSPKTHGVIDYLLVLFLLISPTLFDFTETVNMFTYFLAAVHLVLTALTNFELGLIKVIPFKAHSWVELIVALSLLFVAYYFGLTEGYISRYYYMGLSIAIFITWAVTDYKRNPVFHKN